MRRTSILSSVALVAVATLAAVQIGEVDGCCAERRRQRQGLLKGRLGALQRPGIGVDAGQPDPGLRAFGDGLKRLDQLGLGLPERGLPPLGQPPAFGRQRPCRLDPNGPQRIGQQCRQRAQPLLRIQTRRCPDRAQAHERVAVAETGDDLGGNLRGKGRSQHRQRGTSRDPRIRSIANHVDQW